MTQTGVNSNYGRVLYGLGISPEDIRDMESCFAGVPGLGKFLDNPAVSRKAKHRVIERIFPESLHPFMKTVSDHRRAEQIPGILEAYRGYDRQARGIWAADLYCVSAPDPEQYEQLKEFVKRECGAGEVELTVKKRPELIGGFVLRVGDREYDWSLRGRIRQLEQSLVRR